MTQDNRFNVELLRFERHLVPSLAVEWWLDRTDECLSLTNNGRRPLPVSSLPNCVSPHLTSLHYVKPHMMYVLQYLTEVFHNSDRIWNVKNKKKIFWNFQSFLLITFRNLHNRNPHPLTDIDWQMISYKKTMCLQHCSLLRQYNYKISRKHSWMLDGEIKEGVLLNPFLQADMIYDTENINNQRNPNPF